MSESLTALQSSHLQSSHLIVQIRALAPYACAQLHALNCMLQKAVLSALVVCCGLLAKRLRVRVGVRVRVRVRAH